MRTRIFQRALFGGLAVSFATLPLVLWLAPKAAIATDAAMQQLPAYSRFRCVLCHTSASPTAESNALNSFGVDFRDNGSVWNRTLAFLNSDGDRCHNGFELGDTDGDGVYDHAGEPVEVSNPADNSDCSIAVTRQTWGIIKDLFGRELQNWQEVDTDTILDAMLQYP